MNVPFYSPRARLAHLRELEVALAALVPALEPYPQYARERECYEDALAEARRLLAGGFEQADLSRLSRAVPALFWLHKEWIPPLEEVAPGQWVPPAWYVALEPLERRVVSAAEQLRVMGWY